MRTSTPYRQLSAERRVALVTHAISSSREMRALFIQRLAALPGGFRAVTLQPWPADRLAKEVVRRNAQKPDDERDLLHLLYVELEPAIQTAFVEAAGVKHEDGRIADDVEAPYADADAVRRAAATVRERFGADADHYLRTIARYNPEGWPGIEELVMELGPAE